MSYLYRPQRFSLIVPFLLATPAAPAHAATTWVVTDSHHPVRGQRNHCLLLLATGPGNVVSGAAEYMNYSKVVQDFVRPPPAMAHPNLCTWKR